jgi:transposase-like protein
MNPTTVFCPHLACPARGQTGQGTLGIHSRREQRCIGTECRKTFTTTTGPALYRRRTSAETVTRVVTLLAHGCPLQALVVACEVEARTVAAWGRRAGVPGQAVQEPVVEQPRALGQVQADASRVQTPGGGVWMAVAMRVSPRLWLAGAVSAQHDMALMRQLSERVRAGALHRPRWCGTDGGCASIRARCEPLREPVWPGAHGRPRLRPGRHVCIAQVVKRAAQRRVVDSERRRVEGTPARVETLRRRAQGAGVINTADSERLNAPCRERLASLTRRGRARARHTLTLQHGLSLIGTVDNVCTPPEAVALAKTGWKSKCGGI